MLKTVSRNNSRVFGVGHLLICGADITSVSYRSDKGPTTLWRYVPLTTLFKATNGKNVTTKQLDRDPSFCFSC